MLAAIHWLSVHRPGEPHAILSLDIEKAFDLTAWDHLFDTIRRFGTPPLFIATLQNVYNNSSSQILSNGYISSPFPIQNGTQQGCPLSPLLFALALEPLAILLRTAETFRGIHIGHQEINLSMFADDILLFIAHPEELLDKILEILDQFRFADFRVNYSKSNLMPLGVDNTYFTTRPALTKFAICMTPLKYLGVYIPSTLTSLYQANIPPILKSNKNTLEHWRDLSLSLSGRIAVIKSVIFPNIYSKCCRFIPLNQM